MFLPPHSTNISLAEESFLAKYLKDDFDTLLDQSVAIAVSIQQEVVQHHAKAKQNKLNKKKEEALIENVAWLKVQLGFIMITSVQTRCMVKGSVVVTGCPDVCSTVSPLTCPLTTLHTTMGCKMAVRGRPLSKK